MSMLAAISSPVRRAAFVAPRTSMHTSMRASMRSSFRKYSTEPGTNGTKENQARNLKPVAIALGVSAGLAAVYYYLYAPRQAGGGDVPVKGTSESVKVKPFKPTKEDYQKVYNEISALLDAGDYDDGSYGPVLVRLAWHSSGTYDRNLGSGGSNYATMRFEPESIHGANNGLSIARILLEKVKEKHPWISYGDLWTLAGVCSIQELGGPKIPWRPGRIDGTPQDAVKDERLPDASKDASHVREIFYRMGFNDQEITALVGAHALGRCHADRSGFEGPWTFSPTYFTNDFFKLLLNEKWVWRKWSGNKQLQDKATGQLMMLPADYAFVQDKNFKKYVKLYAEDQDAFFKDFSKAFSTLLELGVPQSQWLTPEPWIMKTVDEQEEQQKKKKD